MFENKKSSRAGNCTTALPAAAESSSSHSSAASSSSSLLAASFSTLLPRYPAGGKHSDPRMNKAVQLLRHNPSLTGLINAMKEAGFSHNDVDRFEWIVRTHVSLSASTTLIVSHNGKMMRTRLLQTTREHDIDMEGANSIANRTDAMDEEESDGQDSECYGNDGDDTTASDSDSDEAHADTIINRTDIEEERGAQESEQYDNDGDDTTSGEGQGNNGLSEYERLRLERIARNNARLAALFPKHPPAAKAKKKGGKISPKPCRSIPKGPRRQLPRRGKKTMFNSSKSKEANHDDDDDDDKVNDDEVLLRRRRKTRNAAKEAQIKIRHQVSGMNNFDICDDDDDDGEDGEGGDDALIQTTGCATATLLTMNTSGRSFRGDDKFWNDRFNDLKRYKEDNGHCLVPRRYQANQSLGHWVCNQRQLYRLKLKNKPSCLNADRLL